MKKKYYLPLLFLYLISGVLVLLVEINVFSYDQISFVFSAFAIINPLMAIFLIYNMEKDGYTKKEKKLRIILASSIAISGLIMVYILYKFMV